jgi:ABC-type nitrate/sulfonate/bicarbonate transport system substrate-binding protein
LTLLHVIAHGGFWEKYGLDVDYERGITSSDAHRAIEAGDIEFVGGNHISTYGRRARGGDGWVYLGQSVNVVAGRKLIVRADSEINGVADLAGKVVGTRGSHPSLNDWLYLKQRGLDTDRDDVAIVDQIKRGHGADAAHHSAYLDTEPLWEWVRDKKVDAAFVIPPETEFARHGGLKVIDIEPMPMIHFTTVSTGLRFAERHPEIVERFLKAMIEGIHFFKTEPAKTAHILEQHFTIEGQMSAEDARIVQRELSQALEPKLYPSMRAIENVYQEGVRLDKDAKRINPLQLWDTRALRKIDDTGFIDDLYAEHA